MQVWILNWIPLNLLLGILLVAIVCAYLSQPKRMKKRLKNDSSHQTCHKRSDSWRSSKFYSQFDVTDTENIKDCFKTLEDVSEELKNRGLRSVNLIFGIDFSISNRYQGIKTFRSRNLHDTTREPNPYQKVIKILGKTLESLDDDGWIPAFGFGDSKSKDKETFPLSSSGNFHGFEEVLKAYNKLAASVKLSGPTNFAPIIYRALNIVKETKKYHILIIVSDGQVTMEHPTMLALVDASYWPLSIIFIGVGDGPWDSIIDFDNELRGRRFDNFQFVDYHKIVSTNVNYYPALALQALQEIPEQYSIIQKFGLLDFKTSTNY